MHSITQLVNKLVGAYRRQMLSVENGGPLTIILAIMTM